MAADGRFGGQVTQWFVGNLSSAPHRHPASVWRDVLNVSETYIMNATLLRMTARIFSSVFAVLLVFASGARAQQGAGPPSMSVPVTVVLADSVHEMRILRRAAVEPHDVIVLPVESDSVRLAAAMFALLVAREVAGDVPTADAILRVGRTAIPTAWRGRELTRAARFLEGLRTASRDVIPGVGRARAAQLALPSGSMRGRLRASNVRQSP